MSAIREVCKTWLEKSRTCDGSEMWERGVAGPRLRVVFRTFFAITPPIGMNESCEQYPVLISAESWNVARHFVHLVMICEGTPCYTHAQCCKKLLSKDERWPTRLWTA